MWTQCTMFHWSITLHVVVVDVDIILYWYYIVHCTVHCTTCIPVILPGTYMYVSFLLYYTVWCMVSHKSCSPRMLHCVEKYPMCFELVEVPCRQLQFQHLLDSLTWLQINVVFKTQTVSISFSSIQRSEANPHPWKVKSMMGRGKFDVALEPFIFCPVRIDQ